MQGVALCPEQTRGLGRTAATHGADAGRCHVYRLVEQRGRRFGAAVGHLNRVPDFDAAKVTARTAQISRALALHGRDRRWYPVLVNVDDLGEGAR